jgi:hypothetical protein
MKTLDEMAKKYLENAKVEISPYVMRGTSTLGGILSPHSFSMLIDLLKEAEHPNRKAWANNFWLVQDVLRRLFKIKGAE